MTITGKSADIADMHAALDKDAPLDSVRKIFQGTAAASPATVTTNVVLRLDELDRVVDTAGDDITLQLTNGARMTGADLVRRAFTARGYVTLIHPVKGPVNLYRTERLASPKQRTMAAAETPPARGRSAITPPMNAKSTTSQRGATAVRPTPKISPSPVRITTASTTMTPTPRRCAAAWPR